MKSQYRLTAKLFKQGTSFSLIHVSHSCGHFWLPDGGENGEWDKGRGGGGPQRGEYVNRMNHIYGETIEFDSIWFESHCGIPIWVRLRSVQVSTFHIVRRAIAIV